MDDIKAAVEIAEKAADTVKKLGIYEFIIFVAAVLAVVVGFLIFWKVLLPRMIKKSESKTHDELMSSEAKAHKELMSFQDLISEVKQIVENNNNRFLKLEERLEKDANDREVRQAEFDKIFSELNSETKETQRILFEVSCDTQYSIFCNEKADIYERLKAFRNLIAWRKNGGIREAGFNLIRNNMEVWRHIEKQELKIKILDQKYWDETMGHIHKSIFSGF